MIVLKNDPKIYRKIRVWDPMWLMNLSEADMQTLNKNQIHFQDQDADQAVRFQKMVRYCAAKKIHSGQSCKSLKPRDVVDSRLWLVVACWIVL